DSALKHSAGNGLLPVWQSGQAGADSNPAPFFRLEAKFVRQDRFWEIPLDLLLQIRQLRSDNFQSALSGDITVEEALSITHESLQSLLDSVRRQLGARSLASDRRSNHRAPSLAAKRIVEPAHPP